MTFREAHNCAGKAVGYATTQGKELHHLELPELKGFSGLVGEDIFDFLTTRQMIDRRTSFGGTATSNVKAAIAAARLRLAEIADAQAGEKNEG
jgi:argininosuccinate lyase